MPQLFPGQIVPLFFGLVLAIGLSACGGERTEHGEETEGREESRSIRNTESIGYAGDAMADKIDAALDANDQRVKQTEDAADDY